MEVVGFGVSNVFAIKQNSKRRTTRAPSPRFPAIFAPIRALAAARRIEPCAGAEAPAKFKIAHYGHFPAPGPRIFRRAITANTAGNCPRHADTPRQAPDRRPGECTPGTHTGSGRPEAEPPTGHGSRPEPPPGIPGGACARSQHRSRAGAPRAGSPLHTLRPDAQKRRHKPPGRAQRPQAEPERRRQSRRPAGAETAPGAQERPQEPPRSLSRSTRPRRPADDLSPRRSYPRSRRPSNRRQPEPERRRHPAPKTEPTLSRY